MSKVAAKHQLEAKRQKCKIIGAGKNSSYKSYLLPCGHTKEISVSRMRSGGFKCWECYEVQLAKEAKKQKCQLIRKSNRKNHRIYKLPCGCTRELQIGNVKRGKVGCPKCLKKRLIQEAINSGCRLLSPGRSKQFRLYKLPCGHQKEVTTSNMRNGSFQCDECISINLDSQAKQAGCKIVGPGKTTDYRLYELPCGHVAEKTIKQIKVNEFNCDDCLEIKLLSEAEIMGLVILGKGKDRDHRKYLLPCGHSKELITSNVRKKTVGCTECIDERMSEDAIKAGVVLLGPSSKGAQYRKYNMNCCNYVQDIQPGVIRNGYFKCHGCNTSHLDRPSTIYLLRLAHSGQEWLKLGYSEDVNKRIKEYGLDPNALIELVCTVGVKTGEEALALENDLHKKYNEFQINSNLMKPHMSKSGHTECYHVKIKNLIKDDLLALISV